LHALENKHCSLCTNSHSSLYKSRKRIAVVRLAPFDYSELLAADQIQHATMRCRIALFYAIITTAVFITDIAHGQLQSPPPPPPPPPTEPDFVADGFTINDGTTIGGEPVPGVDSDGCLLGTEFSTGAREFRMNPGAAAHTQAALQGAFNAMRDGDTITLDPSMTYGTCTASDEPGLKPIGLGGATLSNILVIGRGAIIDCAHMPSTRPGVNFVEPIASTTAAAASTCWFIEGATFKGGDVTTAVATRQDGGAFAVGELDELTLTDVIVTHNNADSGGGVFIGGGEVNLRGGTRIDSNSANASGGGVNVQSSGILRSFDDVVISSNGALMDGGGVFVTLSTFSASDRTLICSNIATGGGGGIDAVAGAVTIGSAVVITGNVENGGGGGGGIHADAFSPITITDGAKICENAEGDATGEGDPWASTLPPGTEDCPAEQGACCHTRTEKNVVEQDCAEQGGSWTEEGAKCVTEKVCEQLTELQCRCLSGGGVYKGDNIPCAGTEQQPRCISCCSQCHADICLVARGTPFSDDGCCVTAANEAQCEVSYGGTPVDNCDQCTPPPSCTTDTDCFERCDRCSGGGGGGDGDEFCVFDPFLEDTCGKCPQDDGYQTHCQEIERSAAIGGDCLYGCGGRDLCATKASIDDRLAALETASS
jgi:hypothetical protein